MIHPWLGVDRAPIELLDVTAELVVLALPGRRRVGEFLRGESGGREWHAFAASTWGAGGTRPVRLVICRSGDWTQRLGRLAESGRLPTSLLIRRMRGFGLMGHLLTYSDVLVIATGAGIGPVLLYRPHAPHPGLLCPLPGIATGSRSGPASSTASWPAVR